MITENLSDFGNNTLYKMCEEQPLHNDIGVIHGKIWLIGHAYSASVSRTKEVQKFKGVDFIKEVVAPAIKRSGIDHWILSIKDIERVTLDNYERILYVHHKLVGVLEEVTGHSKRSLASKYLHFHLPKSVFIYDSIANKEIRTLVTSKRYLYPRGYDDEYAQFVVRCLDYRDNVYEPNSVYEPNNKAAGKLTPRDLDKLLLRY